MQDLAPSPAPAKTVNVVQQPVQPVVPADQPLVDAGYGAIILTCFVGIVKMSAPVILSMFKSKQEASTAAAAEIRTSELATEAAMAATMRTLLEQNARASTDMNQAALEALTGNLSDTLNAVTDKLGSLSLELSKVSSTQAQISTTQSEIAHTQARTLELIENIESSIISHSMSGKPVQTLDRRRKQRY